MFSTSTEVAQAMNTPENRNQNKWSQTNRIKNLDHAAQSKCDKKRISQALVALVTSTIHLKGLCLVAFLFPVLHKTHRHRIGVFKFRVDLFDEVDMAYLYPGIDRQENDGCHCADEDIFWDQISSGCTEEEKVRDGAQHTAHHAGIGLIFNLIVDFVLIFRRDAVQQLFELMNGINRHQRQEKTDADMKRRCHRAEPLAEIFDCTDNAVLKIHKNPRSQRAARTGDNQNQDILDNRMFFIENPPSK